MSRRRRPAPVSALASPREKPVRRGEKTELLVLDADAMPSGVLFVKRYSGGDIVACHHHSLFRHTAGWCSWCFGEARTTAGFTLSVKRYVHVQGEPELQAVLF